MVSDFEYANSQEAWEELNKYFFNNEVQIAKTGGGRYGPQLILYNVFVHIRKGWVDPEFDFGNMFGYRKQKWTSLLNNYVDFNYLDILKSQVLEKTKKRSQNYNISMKFENFHGHGKGCLLSLTVSRRMGQDHPIFTISLRSSEITKRLLIDLLLVQRIAEYIFGEKQFFSIQMFVSNMYQNIEAFTMFDSHIPIKSFMIADKNQMTEWQSKTIETLDKFKNIDPKKMTYKVHLRSVRQLQRVDGAPLSGNRPMKAKDMRI